MVDKHCPHCNGKKKVLTIDPAKCKGCTKCAKQCPMDAISGEVSIALPQAQENLLFNSPASIVLCGHQPDMIRRALEMNVNCLVLCQAELSDELRNLPTKTCIISTPYDAYRAARLIFQSVSIATICRTKDLTCFHLEDRVDEVREKVLQFRDPCYPIWMRKKGLWAF